MQSANQDTLFTDAVRELVAIAAAIGSNCENCLKYHYAEAGKLGVSKADMRRAVDMALQVKAAPADMMVQLADKLLGAAAQARSPCCGGAASGAETAGASGTKCCG